MKKDIILSGVGGQGILSIATIIGYAAVEGSMFLKQAEVHGMSQRGGDVQSHLRISDRVIYSDLIPLGQADLIISVEPMEALRYLPYLAKDGWIISNTTPVKNIPDYPEINEILDSLKSVPNHVTLDADMIAKELGNPKCMNMVMIGAASPHLGLSEKLLLQGIRTIFERKGEKVVQANLEAFNTGRMISEKK